MGLGVYERALVTDGHVCAAGARQWMVGWNVTEGMGVGGHFHCSSVGGGLLALRDRGGGHGDAVGGRGRGDSGEDVSGRR